MRNILLVVASVYCLISCEQPGSVVQLIPSPADNSSAEPFLYSDSSGKVFLSWIQKKGDTSFLKFSTLQQQSWSTPMVIGKGDNWFVNWADYPVMASDGKENLMAHYLEKSAKGKFTYDIKITSSADGGKQWNAPLILHDDSMKAEHGFVSMVPYGDNYFISWLDGRNAVMEGHADHHGEMTLRAAVLNKQGEKLSEWELDNRVCDCCQTAAAITAEGPVVVYRDRSEKEVRDMSIVRLINGKWTSPENIFKDNWTIEGCPVNGPRLAVSGKTMAVVWYTAPIKNTQVNIAFSQNGGASFSKPIRIDEGRGIGRTAVIMLDEETAMVSWMEESSIKLVKVKETGKKGNSITIASSSADRAAGFPQMVRSGGQLIFAWTNTQEKNIQTAAISIP